MGNLYAKPSFTHVYLVMNFDEDYTLYSYKWHVSVGTYTTKKKAVKAAESFLKYPNNSNFGKNGYFIYRQALDEPCGSHQYSNVVYVSDHKSKNFEEFSNCFLLHNDAIYDSIH